jgi:cobalt-zinc-cadmium efflux system membrane fusion protein
MILTALMLLMAAFTATAQDEHAGHDHGEVAEVVALEEPEGYDKDVIVVSLSLQAQAMAGITLARVFQGQIVKTTELPGEVGFNEDRLVHIAPRFPGIALEARSRVGSYVKAGDVVAVVESNESMNSYSIKAPISGWIIERHITPGEYVSGESSIYVLADLSTVWVNLAVYSKDVALVRAGQEVLITAIGTHSQVAGVIDFVNPVLDIHTRSSTARVAVANPNNVWRPGTFVNAKIVTEAGEPGLLVERGSVQFIGEASVVFVKKGPTEFAAVEVVVGDTDEKYARILEGLTAGVEYVAAGAFELKAKIVTSSLSGHAGHGH